MPVTRPVTRPVTKPVPRILTASLLALLSACGSNSDHASLNQAPAAIATATTTLSADIVQLPDTAAAQIAQPTFHVAPVLLDTPADIDVFNSSASAMMGPRQQVIPEEFRQLSDRGLTVTAMQEVQAAQGARVRSLPGNSVIQPQATSSVVSTYTPAQIRAAYGLAALPASMSGLTAAQAAQLGAGQTIYIVDAYHDPNVAAELAAFNQKFGLPGCTAKTLAATSALPLAAPATNACELVVAYNTASGTLTGTAPAYNSGWATEITLDVQWAHATAPLARIVLIEAADASLNSLLGAVKLANAMGPGVVSMSFGAAEGNWTASVDAAFSAAKMTYLAATGDSGAAVSWPSVSPYVVAVGGTSLTYSGSGSRSESGWSGTGGGTSAYTALPSYQNSSVPGMGTLARRTVADVAFNADPSTGQYVAVINPGSTTVNWISAGGTSLSTPQWAGIVAVANATRAQLAKAPLGQPHSILYGQISTVPGTYASTFADIVKGSDGTCATCYAKTGYDQLTGLGTPNIANLISTLAGTTIAPTAPVVTGATISGQVGTALTFTVSATSTNPLTYALSGAPSGMTIASTGIVTWTTPVAGSYAVTVTATDTKTGLSGKAVYNITIAAATAPVVTGGTISAKAGTALSFSVVVTAANPVTYSLSGAPAGMAVSTSGVVSWASPVVGTYNVTAIAKDTKTGLSGQAVYTVVVSAATVSGPVITAPAMTGVAGKALTGQISISDPGVSWVSVSISGVPLGMSFSMSSSLAITASWPSPVTGSYTLKVVVTDSAGRTAQASVPVTITAK